MRRKGESESVADKKRKSFDAPSHQSSNGNIKSSGQILAQLLKELKRLHYHFLQRTQTAHRAIAWNYEARRPLKSTHKMRNVRKKKRKNEAFKGVRLLWNYYWTIGSNLLSELWDDKAVLMKDYDHCVDGKVLELFYLKAADDLILPTTIRG